ncbi:MAG: hypothetical protein WBR15_02950 [Gammaproteobacteria bacterium]
MCDLTDFAEQSFPMTLFERRLARMYHRFTRLDIRDCKLIRGFWWVWIVGRGWVRTTDLTAA